MTDDMLPAWVEAAAGRPVAFAMVREDPLLDERAAALAGRPARVFLVASGGCTACYLAGRGAASLLHLVDANPAQLALARLKLSLLARPAVARPPLLGHAPAAPAERLARIGELAAETGVDLALLGPPDLLAARGLDFVGRYEACFDALVAALGPAAGPAPPLAAVDRAFAETFALPNLVRLFGEAAVRNPATSFAAHFAARARVALAAPGAAANPYVQLVFAGRLTPPAVLPWAALPPPAAPPAVVATNSPVEAALRESGREYDLVHLSNVLDWLSPDEARSTLAAAAGALRPGGVAIVRQLNSTVDVRAAGPMFAWDDALSRDLHTADRSWFYRAIHVGRVR